MEALDKSFPSTETEVVFFHKNCPDGFASAWVAHSHLGTKHVFYHAIAHGEEPPWDHLAGKNVLVVDFSWPRDVTLHLKEIAKGFVLLDHHKTAVERLDGIVGCHVELGESGASLAWLWFESNGEGTSWGELTFEWNAHMPRVIKYVRDRDLWQWALPFSREFNAALYVEVPFDFDEWDARFDDRTKETAHVADMITRGECYLAMQAKFVEPLAKWAIERIWRGLTCRVAQVSPRSLASEVGESILQQHPSARVAVCWTYDDWTKKHNVSLRAREGETDVTAVAEAFGGGGHHAAAAFGIDLKGASVEAPT